jgi:hypothetical protein
MTDSAIAGPLGRALHFLEAKRENIFNSDAAIESGWAADGRNRGLWYDRAQALATVLVVLGWGPPSDPKELNAVQLSAALSNRRR